MFSPSPQTPVSKIMKFEIWKFEIIFPVKHLTSNFSHLSLPLFPKSPNNLLCIPISNFVNTIKEFWGYYN